MVTIKHTRTGIQKVPGERKKRTGRIFGGNEAKLFIVRSVFAESNHVFSQTHVGRQIFEALRVHAPRLGQAG